MIDKIKTLKLWSNELYSVKWVDDDMGDYDKEEQVDVLLGLFFNCLPGDVFGLLATRLGITEEQLYRSCP